MTLRIHSIDSEPFHSLAYHYAAKRGRTAQGRLPFLHGTIEDLPEDLDGIVVTADLQGIVLRRDSWEPRLLGLGVADELEVLSEFGDIPSPDRLGIVLAGDLYCIPDLSRRGGRGDVRPVWEAFAKCGRWVAGTAGNHDAFGPSEEWETFTSTDRIYYLDGETIDLDGLRTHGIAGIIGNPDRPFRYSEAEIEEALGLLAFETPDLLVLHDGPDAPDLQLLGNPVIRDSLSRWDEALVVRGHCHWDIPLAGLNRVQVLNVDSRVVVLTR